MSQGVAAPGCAGLPFGSRRRRFQVAVRLPGSRLGFAPRAVCRRPRVHPWNGMQRERVGGTNSLLRIVALCHSVGQSPRDSGSWTRTNGDIAFFRSRSRQNPRLGLGKIEWETVYHGDSARKRGNHAKIRDSRPAWEKSIWNRFILAISPENAGITPKPATFDPFGENPSGTRLSWRSWSKTRSDWRSRSDQRNHADW